MFSGAAGTFAQIKYPDTKRQPVTDTYFGTSVEDPFRWLEDDRSEETADWVRAQNQVTQAYLNNIPFRDAIGKRYEEIFNYEKFSAPFKEGDYIYYYKNSGLQNQSVLYRQKKSGGEPEVFMDPNKFSSDGTTSLSGVSFSKDGSLLAYRVSQGGSDWQKMIVIDAKTKKQIGDTIELKFSGASWKNNEGFFYSTYPKPTEASLLSGITNQHALYYHKLGTPQSDDILIFGGEKTPRRYVSGSVSEDQKWLFIYAANATYGSELYYLDLTKPGATVQPLVSDMKNSYSVVRTDDKYFYIQTDRDAPKNKLVIAPISDPSEKNWKTLIAEKPEVMRSSSAGKYLFVHYMKDASSKVFQHSIDGKMIREISLPGIGTASGFSADMDETELYYVFTGYTTPLTIYRLQLDNGKSELYRKPAVKFNPMDYESKQVFYTSKDGTKIPMIITHKRGIKLDGTNPTLLYGYGGFNVSLTPSFSTSNIILMENGGIYAVANIRGGGEYGKEWHVQGIKTKKQNVFDDFIAAAEYLIDNRYTSSDYLAIEGGSNGGLLVGAVLTQRPELVKVAFPAVGVLDMLRYHKFTAGAGWAYDYGTSEESKEMFEYLLKYSPLHNLKKADYPATMVTTADHDDRVVPAHSFKFAATLQQSHTGKDPVLIRIETKAGHGAGTSTKQIIEQQKDKWSFMFYNMGIVPMYK